MKKYRCNKCGSVVEIEDNPLLYNESYRDMTVSCQAPFPQRTSGLCLGQLVPFDIKPAPCKDCD